MWPPTPVRRTTPDTPIQRRTIPIDVDGEVFDMDWDRPEPPTQTDFKNWVQQRRNIDPTKYNPPAPLPGLEEINIYNKPPEQKTLSLWDQAKDVASGVGSSVLEAGRGLADIGARVALPAHNIKRTYEDIQNMTGMVEREAENIQKTPGLFGKIGQVGALGIEQGAGIPVRPAIEDVQQGRYGAALGKVAVPTALAALGAKSMFRGKGLPVGDIPAPSVGKLHGPELPPITDPVHAAWQSGTMTPSQMQQVKTMGPPPTPGAGSLLTPSQRVGAPQPSGPVAKAASSPIPELQKAAQQTTMYQKIREKVWKAPGAQAAAELGKGDITVVRHSGEAGPELARVIERTRLLGEHLGGDWTARAREATKGLNPEQVQAYIQSRDTGTIPNDPAVIDALQKRAVIDAEVTQAAKDSGMGLRSGKTIVPFQERQNHWPHIYDKKLIKNNKDAFIKHLEKEGSTPEDALFAVENAGQFGERLISAQHRRQSNAPGYRVDLGADELHLNDMGKRVAEAREFGPKDIADDASPISQLIKGTAEPRRITEIVSQHLGRDVPTSGAESWGLVNQGIRKVMSAAHLSHFAVSNMSQLVSTPLRGNLSAYTSALKSVATNMRKTMGEAQATGALQTINQDVLREVGGEGIFSKAYGMKASESLNRTVASVTGKRTAEQLFTQLKKDPTNKRARARLENLLLEPVDNVLKQGSLSKEQLGISGGRMSQITQGRAQSIDLPSVWKGHPIAEIPLIFKKYAFQQTRIIKDAVMENPARNIPLAIALYGTMGEAIGDVKAGVRGGISAGLQGNDILGGAGQAISDRGEGLNRLFTNLGQAWALGILADLAETGGRASGLAEYIGGPAVSDVGKGFSNIVQGSVKAAQGKKAPYKGLLKQGAQAIPFVGSGAGDAIGGTGKSRGGLPRPPRIGGSLPSIPRP